MTYQNFGDNAKEVIRGKFNFTGLQEKAKSQINNLTLHLNELEKQNK